MNGLLRIYLDAPDIDDFDFENAFDTWVKLKERRGFHKMVSHMVKTT